MAGNAAGRRMSAANKIGITVAEYGARISAGEKWCGACRSWHFLDAFGIDRSRYDSVAAVCSESRATSTIIPSIRERRAKREIGLYWCRRCESWVGVTRGGLCREHRNADYRERYARDGEDIRQRVYARKRSLDQIPSWWSEEVREEFGGWCAYGCGRRAGTFDHIWPVVRGGRSVPGNLVPACQSCNSHKNAFVPCPWVERGMAAFPDQWLRLVALALEHDCDRWMEVA